MKTKIGYASPTNLDFVDFGILDEKGRAVGAAVETLVRTYTALPEDATGWLGVKPGSYFCACVQATRDGKPYGATQDYRLYDTAEERDLGVRRAIAAMRARYAKKYAAKAVV